MRITLYIYILLASFTLMPQLTYAQQLRERAPQPRIAPDAVQNSISRSPDQRLRIPDQFFRHDQARDALRSGNIVSLSVIRKAVSSQYPGRIVDVRLLVPKREGINYLYDVRVLTESGKLLSVKVDAKSAKVIDVKG